MYRTIHSGCLSGGNRNAATWSNIIAAMAMCFICVRFKFIFSFILLLLPRHILLFPHRALSQAFYKSISFDKYLGDSFFVNSSDDKLDSKTLLSELNDRVYIYNPSDIFISIGTNDLLGDSFDEDDYIDNLEDIIYNIKLNRKYSNIYIESIRPIIDDNIKLSTIKEINTKIADLCKNEEITYIDTYSLLVDGNDVNSKYYDKNELNEDGIDEVVDKIKKYINR